MRLLLRGSSSVFAFLTSLTPAYAEEPPPTPAPTADDRAALEAALAADNDTAPTQPPVGESSAAPDSTAAAPAEGGGAIARVIGAIQNLNPDLALILDAALAWYSAEALPAGGHDPGDNGFNFQQLEMALGASVDHYMRLDANLVFAPFGVEVEEAVLTTLGLPWGLQMRAGQFLTRFGRINATHPHAWSFVDAPLVTGTFFGSEGSRGLGVEASWLTPLPWYVEVIASANDARGECCARSFYGADDVPITHPRDFLYTTALEQFFPLSRDWSLTWGLSAQLGPNASGRRNRTDIFGTDLYLRYRPTAGGASGHVTLQTEALWRRRQLPGRLLQDWGLYSQLVWRLDAEWQLGARYDTTSGAPEDPLDPEANGPRHRLAANVTFFPSHFSRLRLQGQFDRPSFRDEPIWGVVLAVEVLIGAHGSHTF